MKKFICAVIISFLVPCVFLKTWKQSLKLLFRQSEKERKGERKRREEKREEEERGRDERKREIFQHRMKLSDRMKVK